MPNKEGRDKWARITSASLLVKICEVITRRLGPFKWRGREERGREEERGGKGGKGGRKDLEWVLG